MPTTTPSVFVQPGEAPWSEPDYNWIQSRDGRRLLDLDPDRYNRVIVYWAGAPTAQNGITTFSWELAERWVNTTEKFPTLFSLIRLGELLANRGKRMELYMPGFDGVRMGMDARRACRADLFDTSPVHVAEGSSPPPRRPRNLLERVWSVVQFFPRSWRLIWDAFGGQCGIGSPENLVCSFLSAQGFELGVEGRQQYPSAVQTLPSVSTAWTVLGTPASIWEPSGTLAVPRSSRAVMLTNGSGIGDPDALYDPQRPHMGPIDPQTGNDHRRNWVPLWREQGRDIFFPLHDVDAPALPACWHATTDEPIIAEAGSPA